MGQLLGRPRQIDGRKRITLSAEVMKLLNLKIGDEIFFQVNSGKIVMGKALIKYELIDEITDYKEKTKV